MSRPVHPIALCAALLLLSLAFFLILVSSYSGPITHGELGACKANLQFLATSLEGYAKDHQGHYPKTLSQLVPHYIEKIPNCSGHRKDSYSSGYRSCANPDNYIIFCCGRNHEREGLGPNQPAHSREAGFSVRPATSRHQIAACQSNLEKMARLIEDYRIKRGQLPQTLAEVVKDSDVTYAILGPRKFRLNCPGLCHAYEGLQADEPAFDSQRGLVPCVPTTSLTKNPRWKNRKHREEASFPLFLGIPAFIFILFTLWPFEPNCNQDKDYRHSEIGCSGWKLIPRRLKSR